MLPSKDRAPACRDSLAADDPHVRERLITRRIQAVAFSCSSASLRACGET